MRTKNHHEEILYGQRTTDGDLVELVLQSATGQRNVEIARSFNNLSTRGRRSFFLDSAMLTDLYLKVNGEVEEYFNTFSLSKEDEDRYPHVEQLNTLTYLLEHYSHEMGTDETLATVRHALETATELTDTHDRANDEYFWRLATVYVWRRG